MATLNGFGQNPNDKPAENKDSKKKCGLKLSSIYLNPNKLQQDIEKEGWREVARFGDRGTEIRAWIKGLVVRYEQVSNRRSTYAPLFCDKGRRYKTYSEAQRVARVL